MDRQSADDAQIVEAGGHNGQEQAEPDESGIAEDFKVDAMRRQRAGRVLGRDEVERAEAVDVNVEHTLIFHRGEAAAQERTVERHQRVHFPRPHPAHERTVALRVGNRVHPFAPGCGGKEHQPGADHGHDRQHAELAFALRQQHQTNRGHADQRAARIGGNDGDQVQPQAEAGHVPRQAVRLIIADIGEHRQEHQQRQAEGVVVAKEAGRFDLMPAGGDDVFHRLRRAMHAHADADGEHDAVDAQPVADDGQHEHAQDHGFGDAVIQVCGARNIGQRKEIRDRALQQQRQQQEDVRVDIRGFLRFVGENADDR